MEVKIIQRNVPEERENKKDRFRVKYGDKTLFKALNVKITRLKTGEMYEYQFSASSLPDKDSIHFTTALENGRFVVIWQGIQATF